MTQQEYETYLDLFASPGWKQFMKAVEEIEDAVTQSAVDRAATNDQWQYCRGQTHQLRSLLGYEDYIKLSWESQNAPDDADANLI